MEKIPLMRTDILNRPDPVPDPVNCNSPGANKDLGTFPINKIFQLSYIYIGHFEFSQISLLRPLWTSDIEQDTIFL